MVKLVDTPAWGAGSGYGVQVRVLFWAPKWDQIKAKALKSNDLGAFLFGENIKNIHKPRAGYNIAHCTNN